MITKDWRDTLRQVQLNTRNNAKSHKRKVTVINKIQGPKPDLKKLVKGYSKIHPQDMLIKINPFFNAVTYRDRGGWPDKSAVEVTPEFVVTHIGDLIKVISVREDGLYMRTNRGYFRFFNLEED